MDYGGGFATGFAAGMGSGIAIGVSVGRKQACDQLQKHIEQNSISLQDRSGKSIKLDSLLDATNECGECSSKKKSYAILAAVLGGLVLIGVLVYWFLK